MIIDLKKYIEADLNQIKKYINIITDKELDIILINENGILSFIPFSEIENVLSPLSESEYIKKTKIYVDRSLVAIIGSKETIDLNKQHADIHDQNIFYSVYKNCKFELDKEYYNKHFEYLISIRHRERVDYLKDSFNKLKTYMTHPKIDLELAKLIVNILTDVGIIERLNLIYHLNYIKQNNIGF